MTAPTLARTPLAALPTPQGAPRRQAPDRPPAPARRTVPAQSAAARTDAAPVGFAIYVELGSEAFAEMPQEVIRAAETLRELAHEWLPAARTRAVLTTGRPPVPTARTSPTTPSSARASSSRRPAVPAGAPSATLLRPRPESSLRARLAAIPDAPPVHVDVVARQLTVDGAVVRLTTREFDLLAALATANGRVLTRAELHHQVWRDRPVGDGSRTLDVHVRRLRRIPALAELITTSRGVGYRIPVRPQLQVTA